MNYLLEFSENAANDIQKLKRSGDKTSLRKLELLLGELKTNPKTGTGKPEQLKYRDSSTWSRRISSKHRLVYKIEGGDFSIICLRPLQ